MKKKNPIRTILTILIITCAAVLLVKNFRIHDFVAVQKGILYTSNQPSGMDYPRLLYKYHLATIVNVRPFSEHMEDNWRSEEIIWTRSNGVKYVEMPIEEDTPFPDRQIQQRFLKIMDKKENRPVLLHGSNRRVAMLVAVWLQKSQGYDLEQTLSVVKKIMRNWDLTAEETDFIRSVAK